MIYYYYYYLMHKHVIIYVKKQTLLSHIVISGQSGYCELGDCQQAMSAEKWSGQDYPFFLF